MDERHGGEGRTLAVAMGTPRLDARQLPSVAPPPYAGFWRRFLASFIDGILVSVVFNYLNAALNVILAPAIEVEDDGDDLWRALAVWALASLTLYIVLNWLYFAAMESSPWQATLGKRALGMAVTDMTGNRISFGRATGRCLARYVSGMLLWLGYLIQPFTARRQALHDIIAGTLVVVRT